jgi:hypothetical protein
MKACRILWIFAATTKRSRVSTKYLRGKTSQFRVGETPVRHAVPAKPDFDRDPAMRGRSGFMR